MVGLVEVSSHVVRLLLLLLLLLLFLGVWCDVGTMLVLTGLQMYDVGAFWYDCGAVLNDAGVILVL